MNRLNQWWAEHPEFLPENIAAFKENNRVDLIDYGKSVSKATASGGVGCRLINPPPPPPPPRSLKTDLMPPRGRLREYRKLETK